MLRLLDNTTLNFNGQKIFKALEHNSRTLTLGTADTHLEFIDPLILSAMVLHTQDGSLSLQGTLMLDNGSLLDSTSGTLTLGGTADNTSRLALPGTTLALQGDLAVSGTLATGAGGTRPNRPAQLSAHPAIKRRGLRPIASYPRAMRRPETP